MIEVKHIPAIDGNDIQSELGFSVFDCAFADMAENDSYKLLPLDDEYYAELEDDYSFALEHRPYVEFTQKIKNELTLIKYFRENGLNDIVLVNISW